MSTLTTEQLVILSESAISAGIAERAGLYSIDDAKEAAKLLGLSPKQWADHLPALVFPYHIPFQRDAVVHRARPAKPFEVPKADGSFTLAKYVQPKKTGVHLYFGPSLLDGKALKDVAIPLWVTEGEKKCLSAESAGLSCIAVPGVTQWHTKGARELHPYFAHVTLAGRDVFLAFDRDAITNDQVMKQERAFGRALEQAGAKVYIVRFPEDAPKLDDFLARHERTELEGLVREARTHGKLPPDTSGPADDTWKDLWPKLRLDAETDRPVRDIDNIIRILAHHPAWVGVLAHDARKDQQVMLKPPPFAADVARDEVCPRPLNDRDATLVADWLVAQRPLGWHSSPRTALVEQALAVVCELNRFDAVRKYLGGLKWDERPRLDAAACTYFGAPNTVYSATVFAKWMLSAVARARTPGCQADHMLILEGDQGLKKSSALRILAGTAQFSDNLPEVHSKEAAEHLLGLWIAEVAELEGFSRSDITALKAFITRREDRYRHAYGRRTSVHPRRCVFAGSTNEGEYLKDSTGNRRFWPLHITRVDLEALERDRDQLWAEAVARVRAGEPWHITDTETLSDVALEQEARRTIDPWHGPIELYVEGLPHVTVAQILGELGISRAGFDQRAANRVVAILRELGWARRQVRLGTTRSWVYALVTTPKAVTTLSGSSGDGNSGAISTVSPLSPVVTTSSPEAGLGARSGAYTPTHGVPNRDGNIILNSSSDSGDSGDSRVIAQDFLSPLKNASVVTKSESGDAEGRDQGEWLSL